MSSSFYRKLFTFTSILISNSIIIRFSLYFANSGLQTQLNLLNTGKVWWTLVVLILMASVAKIVPVTLISKLCSKKPWFYCLSIGVLMNTRGIVQLVVLNIGVELGVISPKIFAIFVLMATILTLFTSPILSILYPKNYDIRKLSAPNTAKNLRRSQEGETEITESSDNNNYVEVISNGDISYDHSKRSAVESSRKSANNLPPHNTFVIFDDRINYVETDPNANEREASAIDRTVDSMINGPRRSICMTRF